MPEYRVYIIDQNNQAVAEPISFESPDDHAALTQASKFADGQTVEVWLSSHRIAHIPAAHSLLREVKQTNNKQVYLRRADECLALRATAPKALWPALADLSNNWKKLAAPSLDRKFWKLFKSK